MEPVSDRLRQTLFELRLCRPADLRRCRRRVRRLARDLPAFDSVWIDALLQARRLTPFQARQLESGRAGELAVGPCILLDQLGAGRWATTYLARVRDGRAECVLKMIELPVESLDEGLQNLRRLAESLQAISHPHVVGPHSALRDGDRLVTVSRHVEGLRLSEMLVRRGRFAPDLVQAIARQLVDGLAVLEEQGVVHGDIRLPNVRLTRSGRAVLVDAGIQPAVVPQLTIHAGLAPDRYDGIAPELIGTGQAPAARSDLYALGCLLWQLLAGRPTFPTGDPLAKLAAHQTRPIEDVREWAPDVTEPLAKMIGRFTARDPQDRPESFAEVRARLRPARHTGHHRLARFRGEFSRGASAPDSTGASRWWAVTAGLLVALGGTTFAVVDQDVRGEVLAMLPERLRRIVEAEPPEATRSEPHRGHDADHEVVHRLPPVDASGVVVLDAPGPFALDSLQAADALVVRGAPGVHPVLVVGEQRAVFTAGHVVLENVIVRQRAAASLEIRSQNLRVSGCRFDSDLRPAVEEGGAFAAVAPPPLIVWHALDVHDPTGGRIVIEDTLLAGTGAAVRLVSAPARIDTTNCLKLGAGPLFELEASPRGGRALRLALDRVTLRDCEAVLRWRMPDGGGATGAIAVDATDCVFALSGPRAALFQLIATRSDQLTRRLLEGLALTGDGSLVRPGVTEIAFLAPDGRIHGRIAAGAIAIEGLTSAPFEFAGPSSRRPADSAVRPGSTQGPRLSTRTPGIDPAAWTD